MPKSQDYTVKLYHARREGNFVVTRYDMRETLPSRRITAAGMDDLVTQVEAFAMAHGKGCRASVKCHASRKPPGFARATADLYFNLDVRPVDAVA